MPAYKFTERDNYCRNCGQHIADHAQSEEYGYGINANFPIRHWA